MLVHANTGVKSASGANKHFITIPYNIYNNIIVYYVLFMYLDYYSGREKDNNMVPSYGDIGWLTLCACLFVVCLRADGVHCSNQIRSDEPMADL